MSSSKTREPAAPDNMSSDTGSGQSVAISLPTGPSVAVSQLTWDQEGRNLSDLATAYSLPLTVRLHSGLEDAGGWLTSPCLDGGQTGGSAPKTGPPDVIFQVHEIRRQKVIQARKMTWEQRQNNYVVSKDAVKIPVSVKGWLEVVSDEGRPVEYFDTIAGIASVKAKRFLVRTSIVGYQLTTEDNGHSCWVPLEVPAGEVLAMGIVYTDGKKVKQAGQRNILKRLLKTGSRHRRGQELQYLQCFDSGGCEVMVPFIMSGVFSPVGESSEANPDAVYELQDLIVAFGLPVNVQLVQSSQKDVFQWPRGVLRLDGTLDQANAVVCKLEQETIIPCDASSCTTREIPTEHALFFRGFVKSKPYIKSRLLEDVPYTYSKPRSNATIGQVHHKDTKVATCRNLADFRKSGATTSVPQADRQTTGSVTLTGQPKMSRKNSLKTNATPDSLKNNVMSDYSTNNSISDHPVPSTSATLQVFSGSKTVSENYNNAPAPSSLSSEIDTESASYSSMNSCPGVESGGNCSPGVEPGRNSSPGVELPERVPKSLKKSRSTSVLDKLSVRRVKKERARLKELRGDDVFSRRISRSDLNYQDFFDGLDRDQETTAGPPADSCDRVDPENKTPPACVSHQISTTTTSSRAAMASTSTPTIVSRTSYQTAATTTSRPLAASAALIQKRELPPIPVDEDGSRQSSWTNPDTSKESLYEHLPVAPGLPCHSRRASKLAFLEDASDSYLEHKDDEDGYMVPQRAAPDTRYMKRSDAAMQPMDLSRASDNASFYNGKRQKAVTERSFRERPKSCGFESRHETNNQGASNISYTAAKFEDKYPLHAIVVDAESAAKMSQLYGTIRVPRRSRKFDNARDNDHFVFNQRDLENLSLHYGVPPASYLIHSEHSVSGCSCYSCSFRKTFPGTDAVTFFNSQTSVSASTPFCHSSNLPPSYSEFSSDSYSPLDKNNHPSIVSSSSADAGAIHYGRLSDPQSLYGRSYPESEPGYRRSSHPFPSGCLRESLNKQGDDSAISLCSRGEVGYASDYDYEGFVVKAEDKWAPPDHLADVSVKEVSKCLRYIGMKDRVILRFSHEQIDGNMLCTLDARLLKEGFPELNALEIKKILDFVSGWRPKKS